MSTFIIAEAGSSHDNDLQKAYRLIEAAKECGADAVKFQWTSNADAMAERRGLASSAYSMYKFYLQKPVSWLESIKAHADKVGIEFMCTVYLIEDIATIAPLVKRFKVSAFESQWSQFVTAHYQHNIPIIVSSNDPDTYKTDYGNPDVSTLWCVSKYPTPIDNVKLRSMWTKGANHFVRFDGFSDHTANVLTGAAAVAAGAKIVEAHIRLGHTDINNPDYPHSLVADVHPPIGFRNYVRNIREVERML